MWISPLRTLKCKMNTTDCSMTFTIIIIWLLISLIPILCWNPIWDKIWDRDNFFLLSPWSWSHLEDEMRGCTSMSHWLTVRLFSFSFDFFLWSLRKFEFLWSFLCFESKASVVERNQWITTFTLKKKKRFTWILSFLYQYTTVLCIHIACFLLSFILLSNILSIEICSSALSSTYLLAVTPPFFFFHRMYSPSI